MATFYLSLEKIAKFKVPPTEGERTLLDFLGRVLDDSYEVYFNPYLNGDRPDVLIMREGNGVLVIEVKDLNLDNFTLNEKKKWVYTPNGSVVKSPVDQVLKYKNNLFDLHVEQLLQKKIFDVRHFNVVACAVYFHCASQSKVENLLVNPFKNDKNIDLPVDVRWKILHDDIIRDLDVRISIIKSQEDFHDRTILTNNQFIGCGYGFSLFKNKKSRKTTTISVVCPFLNHSVKWAFDGYNNVITDASIPYFAEDLNKYGDNITYCYPKFYVGHKFNRLLDKL